VSNIETKVIAATAGSGLGAALSTFLLWVFGVFVVGASSSADQVAKALAAVPEPVGALLAILVAILGAFVGGYSAPHTHRPDLPSPLEAMFTTTSNTAALLTGNTPGRTEAVRPVPLTPDPTQPAPSP